MSREVLAALPAIYDAAASGDQWPNALDALTSAVTARGAILVAFDLVGLPYQLQAWSSNYSDTVWSMDSPSHVRQAYKKAAPRKTQGRLRIV